MPTTFWWKVNNRQKIFYQKSTAATFLLPTPQKNTAPAPQRKTAEIWATLVTDRWCRNLTARYSP